MTEANPVLGTERVTTGEVGVEWTLFGQPAAETPNPSAPAPTCRRPPCSRSAPRRFGTIYTTPSARDHSRPRSGHFPIVGAIAAGGVGREVCNVDSIEVNGVELSATWHAPRRSTSPPIIFTMMPTVSRASVAPALVGQPRCPSPAVHSLVTATWQAPPPLHRTSPRPLDRPDNSKTTKTLLHLGEVVIGDLGVSRPLARHYRNLPQYRKHRQRPDRNRTQHRRHCEHRYPRLALGWHSRFVGSVQNGQNAPTGYTSPLQV